ncbi:hypothetical protein [Saccharopolyspora spinosa]|uniref:hypothetical protein n=1 Tax=Saccharopolyspora spinosa TaxID=60894 RepID=UPI00376F3875
MEELAGRVQLREEQEAELAELRPKAQQWRKRKKRNADRYRVETLLPIGLRCWRRWRVGGR